MCISGVVRCFRTDSLFYRAPITGLSRAIKLAQIALRLFPKTSRHWIRGRIPRARQLHLWFVVEPIGPTRTRFGYLRLAEPALETCTKARLMPQTCRSIVRCSGSIRCLIRSGMIHASKNFARKSSREPLRCRGYYYCRRSVCYRP